MSTVSNILSECNRLIPSINLEATVLEATRLMTQFKVGALVVCEAEQCKGIFTERDLLRCLSSSPQNLSSTAVADVMTCDLLVCTLETDILEARRIMEIRRTRRPPVINNKGKLAGMLTLDDLNAHDFKDQEIEINHLKNYLYGRN